MQCCVWDIRSASFVFFCEKRIENRTWKWDRCGVSNYDWVRLDWIRPIVLVGDCLMTVICSLVHTIKVYHWVGFNLHTYTMYSLYKNADLQNDPHGYLGRFCPSQKSQKHSYVQNWVNTSLLCTRYPLHCSLMHNEVYLYLLPCGPGERGTLGMFGWGCAAGTLESVIYTRASSAEFWSPILE